MTFNKSARAIDKLIARLIHCQKMVDFGVEGWEEYVDELNEIRLVKIPELHEAEIAKYQEIFSWLLGESGVFPTSQQGARYNWRPELRKRLANLKGDK